MWLEGEKQGHSVQGPGVPGGEGSFRGLLHSQLQRKDRKPEEGSGQGGGGLGGMVAGPGAESGRSPRISEPEAALSVASESQRFPNVTGEGSLGQCQTPGLRP